MLQHCAADAGIDQHNDHAKASLHPKKSKLAIKVPLKSSETFQHIGALHEI